jgi:hypothetical protein
MDSQKSKIFWAVMSLPLALLFAGSAAAQQTEEGKPDRSNAPDLVISEDSQLALSGKTGKAVIGSCEQAKPLWEGKIALKNVGRASVLATPPPAARLEPQRPLEWPHVRAYVPNNIELQDEARLEHDLGEFGQELVQLEIGKGEPKCRNYNAPPVFDERLAGRPGPLYRRDGPDDGPERPEDRYGWQIRRLQQSLIEKGYSLPSGVDGDYGPQTIRAIESFFKDRRQPPPREIYTKPVAPETLALLLEALGRGPRDDVPPPEARAPVGDECIRGVNLVPIYVELDPERQIPDENRSNNRVQFTVAIDCSNVAR